MMRRLTSALALALIAAATARAAQMLPPLPGPPPDTRVLLLPSNSTIGARAAQFGPRPPPPPHGVSGYVVAARELALPSDDPEDIQHGCVPAPWRRGNPSSLSHDPPPAIPLVPPSLPPTEPWIALVERGGCAFVDKVRAMQRSGAAAVLVGDNSNGEGSSGLVTMFATGDTSDIAIPSAFVARADYAALLAELLMADPDGDGDTRRPMAWIVDAPDAAHAQWSLVDILLAAVIAPMALVGALYALVRVCLRSSVSAHTPPSDSDSLPATSPRLIAALPIITYYKSKALPDDPCSCVVCLGDFMDEDAIRVLPCRHQYHQDCIDTWLRDRKNVCPICRYELVEDPETGLPVAMQPVLPNPPGSRLRTFSAPAATSTRSLSVSSAPPAVPSVPLPLPAAAASAAAGAFPVSPVPQTHAQNHDPAVAFDHNSQTHESNAGDRGLVSAVADAVRSHLPSSPTGLVDTLRSWRDAFARSRAAAEDPEAAQPLVSASAEGSLPPNIDDPSAQRWWSPHSNDDSAHDHRGRGFYTAESYYYEPDEDFQSDTEAHSDFDAEV